MTPVVSFVCCRHLGETLIATHCTLPVSEEIRLLGVIIDRRLTFDSHISAVVKSCNYHLHALQHIHHLLPFSTAQSLACSLILSQLDYCNAVLYGCSAHVIGQLQRVQNYTVKPAHSITAIATVVTLAVSAAVTCLQSSTYYVTTVTPS